MKTKAAIALVVALVVGSVAMVVVNPFENEAEASAATPIHGVLAFQNANSPHIGADGALMDVADQINLSGGQLNVVLGSGKPELLCSGVEIQAETRDASREGRTEDSDSPLAPIFLIDTAKPASAEIDYVESIRALASQLNSQTNQNSGRSKTLYIFGSGIDTANEKLSFTRGILSHDYKAIIDDMESLGVLPGLEGVNVIWVGLAKTAEPQMKVPYEYVPVITDLWNYFLEKCGAQSVAFQDIATSNEANTVEDGYPYVTPVPFAPTETEDWWLNEHVSLNEGVLGFEPESAVYRDGDSAAKQTLQPFAEALCYSGQVIVVCASAWNDGTGDEIELSYDRAVRVRNDLMDMGVPPAQLLLAAAGNLGTDVHIGDQVVDFYHPDQPETSRAVHFIPTDDGQADEILFRFGVDR